MSPTLPAIMGFVLVGYLVIGMALPVLPLYLHDRLGDNDFIVGIVAGSPFAAALLSRVAAGRFVDGRGAKNSVFVGLLIASGGGLLYTISLGVVARPEVSTAILTIGRASLGIADSFIITGALSWGLTSMGTQNTGKVMAWVGTSIYGAFAIGAPAGTALYATYGLIGVAYATMLVPLAAVAAIAFLPAPASTHNARPSPLRNIARIVWLPGAGVALSGVGFGAILGFVALLFEEHHWTPAWPAFSAMSLAFIAGRLGFGSLPDRLGGAKVTVACVIIEAAGLLVLWLAPSEAIALSGITLTALGYALVYPALGVEAIRRAPSESRGVAMGSYTAFLDLSLGISGPLLGFVSTRAGLSAVYLISSVAALCAAFVAVRLLQGSGRRV